MFKNAKIGIGICSEYVNLQDLLGLDETGQKQ